MPKPPRPGKGKWVALVMELPDDGNGAAIQELLFKLMSSWDCVGNGAVLEDKFRPLDEEFANFWAGQEKSHGEG